MKKLAPILGLVLIIVVIVGLVLVFPWLRLAKLERSLYSATSAKAAAAIARNIIELDRAEGIAVIDRYADQGVLRAFDATHNILLLGDKGNGEVHQVHVGPEGTPVSTGDRSLDSAITAALPQVTSFSIGNPPKRLERIDFLKSEENHSDFILKPIYGEKQYRVSFRFSRGRLVSQGLHQEKQAESNIAGGPS